MPSSDQEHCDSVWRVVENCSYCEHTRIPSMSHPDLCHVNPVACRLTGLARQCNYPYLSRWLFSMQSRQSRGYTGTKSKMTMNYKAGEWALWRRSLLSASSHVRHLNGTRYGRKNICLSDEKRKQGTAGESWAEPPESKFRRGLNLDLCAECCAARSDCRKADLLFIPLWQTPTDTLTMKLLITLRQSCNIGGRNRGESSLPLMNQMQLVLNRSD